MEYDYGYEYGAELAGLSLVTSLVSLIIAVLMIAAMWKMFTKAGQPGWAAIIPIYNLIVLLQIVGRPAWWVILYLVPLANVVAIIIVSLDLAKAFGKGAGYGVGLIVLPYIFYPMLGFGSSAYRGPMATPA